MKRILIAAVVIGCMGIATRAAGPSTQPTYDLDEMRDQMRKVRTLLQMNTDAEKEIAQLKRELAAREREVAELKRQLAGRATIVPRPELAVPYGMLRQPSAPDMPPGSERREFNGVPYYVVPLSLKAVPPTMDTSKWPIGVEYHYVKGSAEPDGITVRSWQKQQWPAEIVPGDFGKASK